MAIQRKAKTLSGTTEQWEVLRNVSERLALTESEIVHLCIEKVAEDETMQQMILRKFIEEKGKHITRNRLLRIMSIKKWLQKKRSASFNQRANRASNLTQDYDSEWERDIQRTIEIAQTPWIDKEW